MKKIFIILFVLISFFIFSKEKLDIIKFKASDFGAYIDKKTKKPFYAISNKILIGTGIQFIKENGFELVYGMGPGSKMYLEYNIKDNVLYTYLNKEKSYYYESYPDELKHDKLTWTLEKDETNLFCNEKLVSNTNFILWNIKSEIPEGSIRYADNIKIYIIKRKYIKLLYNVKVRNGPGTNYEYNKYKFDLGIKGITEMNYIPKGKEILIIGRSIAKQKIDEWNDYWYYCNIYLDPMIGEKGEENGWIYGALLDK